jgi:hypothetical protein
MGGEFLSFDEALAELQMATHELRSMVAQGELRAFRDEDVLKFRRTDILDLKKARDTDAGGLTIEPQDIGDDVPTLAEPVEEEEEAAPGEEVKPAKHETEETELLTGVGKEAPTDFLGLDDTTGGEESADTAQTVVPTIEIADEDMVDDTAQTVIPSVSTDEETTILGEEDTAEQPEAPALLAEEDEATEMATQEISPDEVAPTAPAEPVEEPLRFQDADAATAAAAGEELGITTDDVAGAEGTAGVTAPRRSQRYMAEAATTVSPLFLVLAIATFVFMLFAVPLFYGLAKDDANLFPPYDSVIQLLRDQTIGK